MAATTTAQAVNDMVRALTNDLDAVNPRVTVAQMILFIDAAQKFVAGQRSDARVSSAGAAITIVAVTALAQVLQLDDRFADAIVDHVAHRAWQCPSGSAENSKRSDEHFKLCLQKLGLS